MKRLWFFCFLILISCADIERALKAINAPIYKAFELKSYGFVNGELGFKCIRIKIREASGLLGYLADYFTDSLTKFENVLISENWPYKNGVYELKLKKGQLQKK